MVLTGWMPPAVAASTGPAPTPAAAASNSDLGQQDTPESLAVAEARKSGKDVPVAAMRREAGDVTARPDGTLVATLHTKPVRALKEGMWQDIDTSLHRTADGSVAPRMTLPDVAFSGGGEQPLIRMNQSGKEVRLNWPDPLPAPVLDGDTAEYRSVLPDVDLRLTATETGFTQFIVVKSAAAAKNPRLDRLQLGLNAPGLTMRQGADGSLKMTDAVGGTVFEAPKPIMFDSSPGLTDGSVVPSGIHHQAGPESATPTGRSARTALASATGTESQAHTADVQLSVPTDQKSLLLTPNQSLLDSPATVFPVLIDPNLQTPRANGWAGISQSWENNAYWKFTGDFGTGRCIAASCASGDVKRVLYSFPVKGWGFVGKRILSAKLNVWETHAFSCTKKPLQMYATSRIGTGTTWKNSSSPSFWVQHLQTINAARGYDGCAAGYVEFGGGTSNALRDKVQQAANGDWVDLTLGLKAENEADGYAWKRFNSNAGLQVTYNLPPRQAPMSDLSMSPGSVCSTSALVITKHPQITAKVSDPDGDAIGVQFGAHWDNGDGTGMSGKWYSTGALGTAPPGNTFKASGSAFSVTLPGSVPQNKLINWAVRGWDGTEWGPWSYDGNPTACYFQIDTSAPAGPVTTSPHFPGSTDAQASLPWTDGVGRYGTFTFDTSSTDAVKYQWGLNQLPSAANSLTTTGGAPQQVSLLMEKEGPQFVSVRALDSAGNASEPTTYYFNVRRGQAPRAGWSMDGIDGGGVAGSSSDLSATLAAGTAGAPGHIGNGVLLDGTRAPDTTPVQYLSTSASVLETHRSFTVSAWVKVTSLASAHQAVVSQTGKQMSSMELGISEGKWALKTPTLDDSATSGWHTAYNETAPVLNQWTHLAGTYDADTGLTTVFVNGQAGAPVGATVFNARGPMDIGRMLWRGTYTDPWFGSLDEIRAYDRSLSPSEITALATDQPITGGFGAKAVWTLDEAGTTMAGRSEVSGLKLTGSTQLVPGVKDKALALGATGYATTARPHVEVDGSFAVSAWVRRPALVAGDTGSKVILSQSGAQNAEFTLSYSGADKKWVFARPQSDSAAANVVQAKQATCTAGTTLTGGIPCVGPTAGEWTHLLGVSDTATGKLRLYVNGFLSSETAFAGSGGWSASKAFTVGATERNGIFSSHFGGDVDDIAVFDRVVTQTEAREMLKQRPQLLGRWKFNTATAGSTPGEPAGAAAAALSATGAAIVADGGVTALGSLALQEPGYASTTVAPRTNESFALAGWASAGSPMKDMTVMSVAGANESAISVGWHFDKLVDGQATGWWEAKVTGVDGSTANHTTVTHTFDQSLFIGDWNHIAVVYDGFSGQLALYVNGNLENQICADGAGSDCTSHVSFAPVTTPFTASGGLQFGRSRTGSQWVKPLTGEIDDVWVYQGVLSPAQITALADPTTELDTATGV
ncbi:LamG domain-containing protein [Streptomyces sp. NPDC102278]|uniref:LamG domain-containing protein n=1 Tax=Streptomyces sp. NPDC102278 TaxID=3366152 RepID=UPI00382A2B2B